jgi:hypothetical protein
MSPKRLVLFLTLVVTWPFWLLLRTRFGEHFLVLLFLAWGLGYAVTWSLMQPETVAHWRHVPELDFLHQLLPLLADWYPSSISVWLFQIVFLLFNRLGVFLGETAPPHRWYTGCFWFCRYNYAIPDIIGSAFIWFTMAAILSNHVDVLAKSAPMAAGMIAAAFIVVAYTSFLNGHILPFGPPAGRQTTKRAPRYIARLRSTASRSREGLGQIFSRRDPALMRISRK